MIRWICVGCWLLITTWAALAQSDAQQPVTADQVNAVARQLYCPVCENIPLDTCGTAACEDWRYEIRLQLEAGLSPEEIREDFVRRFGDRVVGTPHDPVLRALSLVTPYVLIVLGAVMLAYFYWVGRSTPKRHVLDSLPTTVPALTDEMRSRIEQDLMR